MYHELTYEHLKQQRRGRIVRVCVVLALVAVLALAAVAAMRISAVQTAASIEEAVVSAAMQCAAVEGSYPSSLSHLEESYGLTVNHRRYLIYYEWLGDNVPPSVRVVPR